MTDRTAGICDVVVLGAGAAGLMCAIEAGKRGRRVRVIEHAQKPAEKIRISGGGRCNFTNTHAAPEHFLSRNPPFCVSALSRYRPEDFIALVEKHGIAYHEKTLGQLFCNQSSAQIIHMLLEECRQGGVEILTQSSVEEITKPDGRFQIRVRGGKVSAHSLVVATGGLSIPKMGATDLGYRVARQFGLETISTVPALVPFTFSEPQLKTWQGLTGVAAFAQVRCGKQIFRENILFTHGGLSGPAILQISSYWQPGNLVHIDLAPEQRVAELLLAAKRAHSRQSVATSIGTLIPKRLAQRIVEQTSSQYVEASLAAIPDRELKRLADAVHDWQFLPGGTEGYRTAEVTLGGVDTVELSSQTMQSRRVSGLYFIGEVVDVTGHLGGYNFQWAWASGVAAGRSC